MKAAPTAVVFLAHPTFPTYWEAEEHRYHLTCKYHLCTYPRFIMMYSESTEHGRGQCSKVTLPRPQALKSLARSLAFALSTKSTPTRIFEAFQS